MATTHHNTTQHDIGSQALLTIIFFQFNGGFTIIPWQLLFLNPFLFLGQVIL